MLSPNFADFAMLSCTERTQHAAAMKLARALDGAAARCSSSGLPSTVGARRRLRNSPRACPASPPPRSPQERDLAPVPHSDETDETTAATGS